MGIPSDLHNHKSPTRIKMKLHLLAVCFVASVSGGHHGRYSSQLSSHLATKTITELVASEPRFSTLLAAVAAADLADTLASPGPFTVFAPTNDAFAKVPSDALNGLLADKEALTKLLLRHVVTMTIYARNIGDDTVDTAGGNPDDKITAKKDGKGVTVSSSLDSANIIAADIAAKNGVVHAIDTVI